jgi:hypothetical protein
MAHHEQPGRHDLDPDAQDGIDPTTDAEKLEADELEQAGGGAVHHRAGATGERVAHANDRTDDETDAEKLQADGLQGRQNTERAANE